MTEDLKESLKKPIRDEVKKIVSDTVRKLVKASAKKTVTALRDRLGEEATRRVEKRLEKTAKKLEKELISDTPQDTEYVSKIKQVFEKDFQRILSSLSRGLLKPIIITCVCALVAGGLIGWWVVYQIIKSPPQPDLIITEITLEIEVIASEEEPVPGLVVTPEPAEAPTTIYEVTVHYTIENQGDEEAGESTSCLLLNGEVVAEDIVNPLAPGEKADGAFYDYPISLESIFPFLESGYIDIELRADAGKIIEESNEENNSVWLKAELPGD